MNSLVERSDGIPGCEVSATCNTKINIPNSQIPYDPNNPTAAQKASAARDNCGAINSCSVFNAKEQLVSVTGAHAYQSPATNQLRGPCPGLNAAANHGYLPRSGAPTILQTINGLGAAYGMSLDLAGILAAYAVAIDGDPVTGTWSIGGPQAGLPIIENGQGISWSHNKYEGDTSIGRCDAYINNGDAHSLSTTRYAYAYEVGMADDSYTFDKFAQAFTANTFRSIQQNPYYFAPLFSTTLVAPAAYNFVIAFMSNHTAQQPGGYLNGAIFKEFFAITGDYPNFSWQPGQERIPNNWYRRPSSQQYQAVGGVFGDLIPNFLAYPNSFRFGGNTGKVNTYTGIDLANYTNGVYNADNLFQGNNFACFVYQNIQQGQPDSVNANPLASTVAGIFTPYLNKVFGGITCPQLQSLNDNNLGVYPGHKYSPNPPANAPENC
ncbi:hypothetical protein BDY17DRAFT_245395 [Neohortaea acidophila]|uniref:Heme haloperoxidase family profile domain-containing protein n=1 Tax=Neohortaea acidophila TaxID=245834 RepID=A0A6A6Q0Z2_9PEZI|nr:uncharacterized protein BDY17DRAFT_245395 [Neohortaea acidophila]KAF2485952.1 hypothetical protein BDY17DRAFT_245395 [Neohortaea acidophila]